MTDLVPSVRPGHRGLRGVGPRTAPVARLAAGHRAQPLARYQAGNEITGLLGRRDPADESILSRCIL